MRALFYYLIFFVFVSSCYSPPPTPPPKWKITENRVAILQSEMNSIIDLDTMNKIASNPEYLIDLGIIRKGEYRRDDYLRDAWGNHYEFRIIDSSLVVFSNGKDGISNSYGEDEDDISGWGTRERWRKFYKFRKYPSYLFPLISFFTIIVFLGWCLWIYRMFSMRNSK